jgi:hypothetical protein
MTLEQTVKEIQDALIVMGELEVRQSRVHEELEALRATIREGLAAHEKRMQELDERILKLVSGIGELLRK